MWSNFWIDAYAANNNLIANFFLFLDVSWNLQFKTIFKIFLSRLFQKLCVFQKYLIFLCNWILLRSHECYYRATLYLLPMYIIWLNEYIYIEVNLHRLYVLQQHSFDSGDTPILVCLFQHAQLNPSLLLVSTLMLLPLQQNCGHAGDREWATCKV